MVPVSILGSIDYPIRPWSAYHGHLLPHHWFSDGDLQLLPKHRHGQQVYHSLPQPTATDSAALPAHSTSLFSGRGRMVQYASQ